MDLRQAEYVLAVVDHGGFTRAASAVHVSQPALSQGIRALEGELGTPLFHRLGRSVSLTPAGEAFVESARRLVRDAEVARQSVAAVVGLTAGRLDLVVLPTLAVEPTVELVGRFRRLHPGVTVTVAAPESVAVALGSVRDGSRELGLVDLAGDDAPAGLLADRLGTQELVAVCPPGSISGDLRRRRSAAQFAHMPLVTTPVGTSTRRLVDEAFSAAEVEPTIAVETDHRDALLPLVLAGAGATFLPRPLARPAADAGAVVVGMSPPLRRSIGLVRRPGPLSPAAAAFRELALDAAG